MRWVQAVSQTRGMLGLCEERRAPSAVMSLEERRDDETDGGLMRAPELAVVRAALPGRPRLLGPLGN